ncbi:hypothetical protein [Agarivorans sp. Alg241-V36]|uniref:hypothetical protein n=1 Tax=Agarivorans sp. Alg241-V36 TaxID=2305992 RepID=UPI0013CF4D78|nr:hypothetical protein [Agarivorans sp. Alg241-V36]
MSKNAIFKITMLAGAVALAGCTESIEEPVDPPVEPPVGDALVIIDDGIPATNFGIIVGSNSDSYNRQGLAKGESYAKTSALEVSPSDNAGSYTWKVDTYSSGDDGSAEVYFIVGSDASQMDLTEYQNGVMLIDLSVLVAADSATTGHQLIMQTNTGTDDYLNRSAFYFNQTQLADLEADGWTTIAIKMSCFTPQNPTFDITKVNDLMRFDIRGNESVSYEIGKVAIEKEATSIPAEAVEWTCS